MFTKLKQLWSDITALFRGYFDPSRLFKGFFDYDKRESAYDFPDGLVAQVDEWYAITRKKNKRARKSRKTNQRRNSQ